MKEWNTADFDREIADRGRDVVVDFWAPWCGYCRRLAPVLERMEGEYGDRLDFVKVDIDSNATLAERFEIDTIPTLVLFRGGKAVASVVNPESQAAAVAWLRDQGAL